LAKHPIGKVRLWSVEIKTRIATLLERKQIPYCGNPPLSPTYTRRVTLPTGCEPVAAFHWSCCHSGLPDAGATISA
jgi:hypothetical protein